MGHEGLYPTALNLNEHRDAPPRADSRDTPPREVEVYSGSIEFSLLEQGAHRRVRHVPPCRRAAAEVQKQPKGAALDVDAMSIARKRVSR